MSYIWDIINRYRQNRGFGVQSPAAFFFVTQILRNKHQYYIYPKLDKISQESREFSSAHCKRLFRLANYIQPSNIILFGRKETAAACALSAGKTNVPCYTIGTDIHNSETADNFLQTRGCISIPEENIEELKKLLNKHQHIGVLHIGQTEKTDEVMATAMQYINNHSVIIVEGIHRNIKRLNIWKKAIENPCSIVTFDLYSMGILFFDNNYKKQHYTLKFK